MKKHNKINLWGAHTSTVLSITLVLFMLGLLLMTEYHSYIRTHDAEERITYKVDLLPDVPDSMAVALQKEIAAMPYVKQVDYISKEEAAQLFSEDLGEDFVGFLGYNPLFPSLMVNFRADLLDTTSTTIDKFSHTMQNKGIVTGVAYQENIVSELNETFYKITWILIIFIALQLIISILMIYSTIRIALYAQRSTIKTMRLVGATMAFLTRPYMMRSLLYGALGGLLADVLLFGSAYVIDNEFGLSLMGTEHILWYSIIAGSILLLGVVIALISTRMAVRKYIKTEY